MAHQAYQTKLLREMTYCAMERRKPPQGLIDELTRLNIYQDPNWINECSDIYDEVTNAKQKVSDVVYATSIG